MVKTMTQNHDFCIITAQALVKQHNTEQSDKPENGHACTCTNLKYWLAGISMHSCMHTTSCLYIYFIVGVYIPINMTVAIILHACIQRDSYIGVWKIYIATTTTIYSEIDKGKMN